LLRRKQGKGFSAWRTERKRKATQLRRVVAREEKGGGRLCETPWGGKEKEKGGNAFLTPAGRKKRGVRTIKGEKERRFPRPGEGEGGGEPAHETKRRNFFWGDGEKKKKKKVLLKIGKKEREE